LFHTLYVANSPFEMVFSERLKGLDAFTKPYEDFHEKTVYGGAGKSCSGYQG
jgi:hypothetical protein